MDDSYLRPSEADWWIDRTYFFDEQKEEFIRWINGGCQPDFFETATELTEGEVIEQLIGFGCTADHYIMRNLITYADQLNMREAPRQENFVRWRRRENIYLKFWTGLTKQPVIKIPSQQFEELLAGIPESYREIVRAWFLSKFDSRVLGNLRNSNEFRIVLDKVFIQAGVSKGHPIYTLINSLNRTYLMKDHHVDWAYDKPKEYKRRRRAGFLMMYEALVEMGEA